MIGKLSNFCSKIGEIIGAIFMAGLFVTMSVQVFFRYVLNSSLSWTDEFAPYMLIALTFFAGITCFKEGRQLAVGAFANKLQQPWRSIIKILAHVMTTLMLAVLVFYGTRMAIQTLDFYTISVPVSRGLLYTIMPVGALLMSIVLIQKILLEIGIMRKKKGEDK